MNEIYDGFRKSLVSSQSFYDYVGSHYEAGILQDVINHTDKVARRTPSIDKRFTKINAYLTKKHKKYYSRGYKEALNTVNVWSERYQKSL